MGSVLTLLQTWATDGGERYALYGKNPGLVLRWLNDGQLRFSDKSEILRKTWKPIFPSSGKVSLPDDFLRVKGDKIQWNTNTYLGRANYEDASVAELTTVEVFSVFNGYMYVFAAASGTPTISYIRKPDEVLFANISTDDLELPTEHQDKLLVYMDAQFARKMGDVQGWLALTDRFDGEALQAGLKYNDRQDSVPFMAGRRL